ncbi:MAG: proton-conducting membrane transporter [Tenericutes bacterium]|nr:proton-conducting membrane transporter [Mycoplasmatota bacterium]
MTTSNHQENQNKRKFLDHFTWKSSGLVLLMLVLLISFIGVTKNWFGVYDWIMSFEKFNTFITSFTHLSIFPLVMISIPLIGGFIQLAYRKSAGHKRDWVVIFMTFLTIPLTMMMYPVALEGGIVLDIPYFMGLGISFDVDMLGFTMLMITTIIWFIVMVYAHEYMKKEIHNNRFFFFMALTYSSVLGTIMAGDLLTMFLFFEIMTITSYVLVTHTQREESYAAGYNYIFMGLIGGFSILVALLLMYFNVGDLSFKTAIVELNQLGSVKYWIMGLLVLGFGIKAGMAPVHVWLPRAHPVAPTPASALLSGIMIKVGAFGVLRVAVSYFFPAKGSVTSYEDPIWLTTQNIGSAIIWMGIITMAIGVFLALQQSNIKKMLAYHSISQMGYIVVGIGVALYLGYRGAMGYSGALYHIINHALFKSLLFMVAGVVYYHTKEQDMYKLGGLWRKLPLTATVCLIASLGISGIPLFNGFVSKSILHHGIVEAYKYGHSSFFYAELIFIVVSAGTVCSFIKMNYYVFFGKMPEQYKSIKPEYNCLDTSMVAIAFLIILIGLNPSYILNQWIMPQLNQATFDPYFINSYIVGLKFFTGSEFLMTLIVVGLGFLIFIFGTKFHWFHLKFPNWLRIEYIFFYPANFMMRRACKLMYGDQCPIDQGPLSPLALKNNESVGFLERFVTMTNVFNRRYETSIIKSDAFIYTSFITTIFIFMMIFNSI